MPFNEGVWDFCIWMHCCEQCTGCICLSILSYIFFKLSWCLFLSVSLASALWNSLGRIAIHPHLIVTLFFIFFLLKIRIALNKSSGTKTMKTEHFTGRHGCKKPHTAPVSTLKIHCFSFVNVLLLCIVHSSKKQQCYVTSCCISGPSMDISCDVKIISGAQALCSTF